MKEDGVQVEGEVLEAFPNAMFKVKIENGVEVLASICGKIRKFSIRILPQDRVIVEL